MECSLTNIFKGLKILSVLLAMVLVTSCDDDVVGKWDPMKWEYKNISEGIRIIKPNREESKSCAEIEVSRSGSVDIVCKNYKNLWFVEYPDISYDDNSHKQFSMENCEMKIEGNTIHCEFINIEPSSSEKFSVAVSAGDVFFQFGININ